MAKEEKGVTASKEKNFSEWYTQVIQKAELMDYSKVSGCMVIRPYAYEMWERIKQFLDKEFKKLGVKNAYFPLLIPESLLTKEQHHVEGFSPEVAWVTHAGDSELSEKLAIRPTSETIMYDTYKNWIRSHRDLPLLINQWANVVRWEFKNPMPFLRTREFLWQEGHTAYATKEGAEKETYTILDIYKKTFEELLAVPMLDGRKSEKEKFAGADYTLSVETIFPNGKAIQGSTSHHLGQNFSKPFDIKFLDENEEMQYVWQNSWGFTTRSIGISLAMHGDDKGLIIPPKIAPTQAVIVPILFENTKDKVLAKCEDIKKELSNFRVELDDREEYKPGWKFNQWEMKGIPIRIEIGPKDIEKEHVVMVRRDNGKKEFVKFKDIKDKLKDLLSGVQQSLFDNAKKFMDDNTVKVENMKDLKKAVSNGKFAYAPWCGGVQCEDWLKDKSGGAKSLNIPFNQEKPDKKCIQCDKDAEFYAYFAKSY